MKKDWILIERALTLYCTGKFASRSAAMKEALAERQREQDKKNPQDFEWIPILEDGD